MGALPCRAGIARVVVYVTVPSRVIPKQQISMIYYRSIRDHKGDVSIFLAIPGHVPFLFSLATSHGPDVGIVLATIQISNLEHWQ